MVTKVKIVTPNADSAMDEVNDAVRVNMVAGTVTISGADGAIQDGVTPTIRATVKDYANSKPLAVVTVNTSGDPVSASGMTDVEFAAHLPLHVIADSGTISTITNVVHIDDNAGSLTVDGSVTVTQGTGTNLHTVVDSGTVTAVTSITNVVHVDDNAGSLTVDGTVAVSGTVAVTKSGTWIIDANSGVDIGDVTINNAGAGAAVNIQDGGNSITVDGSVSVSGTTTTAESQVITDNATFTDGTSKVFMAGHIFDEVAGTALTENDAAAARVDSKRAQVMVVEDATTRGTRQKVVAGSVTSALSDPAAVVDIRPDNLFPAASVAGDGKNPSGTMIYGCTYQYNGATWDKQRANFDTSTGDVGAKTLTFGGATQINYNARGAFINIRLAAVSGTTPTLAAQMQWSPDNSINWVNFGPALANLTTTGQTGIIMIYPTNLSQAAGVTPANLTNGGTVSMMLNMPLPRTWRILYTIGGTTPSFTITAVYVNYMV